MTPAQLSRTVLCAVRRAVDDGELNVTVPERVVVGEPGPGGCGDFATAVALRLAPSAGQPARRVAEVLRARLVGTEGIRDVVVTGPGFLNISLDARVDPVAALVREIREKGARYGHGDALAGQVVTLRVPYEVRAEVIADVVVRLIRAQGGRAVVEHEHEPAGRQGDDPAVGGHGGPASPQGARRAAGHDSLARPAAGLDGLAAPQGARPTAEPAVSPDAGLTGESRGPAAGPGSRPAADHEPLAHPAADHVSPDAGLTAEPAATPDAGLTTETSDPAAGPGIGPAVDHDPLTGPAPHPTPLRPRPAPQDPSPLGRDAARWALLHPAPHDRPRISAEHLVQRERNPLFRVRYAHARVRSLSRNASRLGFAAEPGPLGAEAGAGLLTPLADHPRILAAAATHRAPDRLARHLVTVADAVLPLLPSVLPVGEEKPSAAHRARLALAEAAGQVLAGGLSLLGIDAPEHL
ncbi:ArgS-related anticodon-binding protein NrtL [Streptomyces sp. NPDC017405]|uniref:ArgS-related anticodon-binding protein NrtL n=1 Tax=unclassified Streptomyces TaxID=2593676 RepID=UPI0037A04BA7